MLCACAPRASLRRRAGGGGVRGPLRRWLAKGSAAADKTRPAGGAIRVRFIATDFVDNAQELPEQRRCHHRGPLRALVARENQGSKTSHSCKHRLLSSTTCRVGAPSSCQLVFARGPRPLAWCRGSKVRALGQKPSPADRVLLEATLGSEPGTSPMCPEIVLERPNL